MARRTKKERQEQLLALLDTRPFLTDEELARHLHVSVATIRLDRLELGVPEMRQRTRKLAERAANIPVSMQAGEMIGSLQQLELGRWAVSVMRVQPEMVFAGTGILRGHFLFAQANSLAVAVVDAPRALTATARLRFLRPAYAGDSVLARAVVVTVRDQRHLVKVTSTIEGKPILDGRFVVSTATSLANRERSSQDVVENEPGESGGGY